MIELRKYIDELKKVKNRIGKFEKKNRISNVLLFRDYLTRLDNWKVALGEAGDKIYIGKGRNYHNLFLSIKADWVEEIKTQEDFNKDLINEAQISFKGGRFYDDMFIYLFTYWELCKNNIEINEINLPHPYEPAFKIIGRCEFMYTQNANIQIDNYTINNLEKYFNFLMPSLDYDFLDYIDSICLVDNKIPNQIETNELWERFQLLKE
jgi:hypothetical protein